jgi:N-acyl-D-aspartate/D-glutamate deacylase
MIFDLLIKDGFIVDGTGNVWYKADIGVTDSRITAITDLNSAKSHKVINAKGLFVSPGFIDIHTHSDRSLLLANKCESKILQGVTIECVGSCGTSVWPVTAINKDTIYKSINANLGNKEEIKIDWSTLGEFIEKVENNGISSNVVAHVGHGTVRSAVLGRENRFPSSRELEEMKSFVESSMIDGAFGLSSGLDYIPGCYAETSELIELMKVAAKYSGIYASHVRERDLGSLKKAVIEAIEIGTISGARVTQLSHMFQRGQGVECLEVINGARKKGIDVTADIHLAGVLTNRRKLSSIIPIKWRKEGTENLIEFLKDPDYRRKIRDDCLSPPLKKSGVTTAGFRQLVIDGRWEEIKLVDLYRQKMMSNDKYVNLSIKEIAQIRGLEPFDTLFDIIIEERDNAYGSSVRTDESVRKILIKNPAVMVATDSSCKAACEPWTNVWSQYDRDYATYTYVLGTWVHQENILSLEEMVRKMTSLPARTLGLRDRGLLLKGMFADIVVYSLDKMRIKSTFEKPHQYPEGVEHVIVNGKIVVENGRHTDNLPGRFLRSL